MSARRTASSVVCEPLPTHLVQPPLIPKRIIAAIASTATGINFLNHPLLSNDFTLPGGVVFSEDGAVLSGLSEVVPLLLEGFSTAAVACCVSAMFYLSSPRAFSNSAFAVQNASNACWYS